MSARVQPKPTPDLVLLLTVVVLLVIGIEMVYSASFVVAQTEFKDSTYFLTKQVLWAIIGLFAMAFLAAIDYHRLERVSALIMVLVVLAMLVVMIPGAGVGNYGAQRWLRMPPPLPPIQPSEFAKLAVIIFMSHWLAKKGGDVGKFAKGLLPFGFTMSVVTGLIMVQPDMGTAAIVVTTAACIFFVAGANVAHFGLIAVGVVGGFAYLAVASDYRNDRLQAFINPWADPKDTGWHTIQTLIALGSGGVAGLGLGASRQKFYWVPNAHTDAIFAIIGEELGFVGVVLVFALFGVLAWRGFRIAFRAPDQFGRLLATGVTCLIVVQALVNVAAITNTIPYTGITLPFISFGGSSLLVCLASVGVLLSVSRHERAISKRQDQRGAVVRVFQRRPSRPRLAASEASLGSQHRNRSRRGV